VAPWERVPDAGIDLHFVRNQFFLEQVAQLIGFLYRDGRVGFAVQDERRAKPAHEKLHLFRQPAIELDHRLHA
jgi:hypothetical protein